MKNLLKNKKGITLIALIITIIVLLILAGVTIAAISSNESAPNKAVQARTENDRGAAKDAATLVVAEKTQEYYEAKYVNRTTNEATVGGYVNAVLATAVTRGDLTIKVEGGKLKVFKGTDTDPLVTGTINSDGTITWDATPSENGGTLTSGTVAQLAQTGSIKRWDKVNYSATGTISTSELPDGAKIEGTKVATTTTLPAGATLSGTIDASKASDWVVLDVKSNGEVLIMPTKVDNATLTLTGIDGYNNAIEALNEVAQIYLNSTYASSARSITVDDVNAVEGHTPDGEVAEYSWNNRYGMNPTTLDITDTGSDSNAPIQKCTSTATTGYYTYYVNRITPDYECWVASRCVRPYDDGCDFYVRSFRLY